MQVYLDLLEKILTGGKKREDRTGVGTISLFAETLRFDLRHGFPLMTTKKMYIKGIVAELLWFLRGETRLPFLHQNDCHIWDQWANNGELGPIYGHQWRKWHSQQSVTAESVVVDQIAQLVQQLKTHPYSRRHLLTAWNPTFLPDEKISPQENVARGKMALAPCHVLAQFYVSEGQLSCQVYLRSQDVFLGTPFNIASYALLTHLLALQCGYEVGELIWVGGDVHLYCNHIDQAKEQLARTPKNLPKLVVAIGRESLWEYQVADFSFIGYAPYPSIKAEIAV